MARDRAQNRYPFLLIARWLNQRKIDKRPRRRSLCRERACETGRAARMSASGASGSSIVPRLRGGCSPRRGDGSVIVRLFGRNDGRALVAFKKRKSRTFLTPS